MNNFNSKKFITAQAATTAIGLLGAFASQLPESVFIAVCAAICVVVCVYIIAQAVCDVFRAKYGLCALPQSAGLQQPEFISLLTPAPLESKPSPVEPAEPAAETTLPPEAISKALGEMLSANPAFAAALGTALGSAKKE